MIEKIQDMIKAIRDWVNARFVKKSGDTMSGYLYNTASSTTDGRKIRYGGASVTYLMSKGYAGGLNYAMADDETNTIANLGYYHNSINPDSDYFYCGTNYQTFDKTFKTGEIEVSKFARICYKRIFSTTKPSQSPAGAAAYLLMFDVTRYFTASNTEINIPTTLFEGSVIVRRTGGNISNGGTNILVKIGVSYKHDDKPDNLNHWYMQTSDPSIIQPRVLYDEINEKYYLGLRFGGYDGANLVFDGIMVGDFLNRWVSLGEMTAYSTDWSYITAKRADQAIADIEGNNFLSSYMKKVLSGAGSYNNLVDLNLGEGKSYLIAVRVSDSDDSSFRPTCLILITTGSSISNENDVIVHFINDNSENLIQISKRISQGPLIKKIYINMRTENYKFTVSAYEL